MKQLEVKVIIYVILTILNFTLLLPMLVSAPNTELVIAGFSIGIVNIYLIYRIIAKNKQTQGNKNEDTN